MTLRDIVDQACQALMAYRLRAVLSAIGMVVGIATVVTALAIGDGARHAAIAEVGALGIDNIFVRATHGDTKGVKRPAPSLTVGDANAIRHRVGDVTAVAAVRSARAEVQAGSRHASAPVLGVEPAWAEIVGLEIASGRKLNDRDEADRRRVAMIAPLLAATLFPGLDPVGQEVRVNADWYRVVGLIGWQGNRRRETPGRPAVQRHDVAAALIVPRSAMDLPLGHGDRIERVDEIAVRTSGPGAVGRASAAVERLLAARAHAAAAYEVVVPRELLRARLRTQRTFNVVLLATGGLALLISGIGIMNIMLASVAARTAEIGVRRAFGARRRDVTMQFAVEATLLCLAGGIAGLPLGVALSAAVAWIAGWPVSISVTSVALAFVLAGTVGLTSGIHPARVAARLDPACALRAE